MTHLKEYSNWLESDVIDDQTKDELQKLKNNPDAIEERFYKDLEFGTGGIRGIIGAGTNRVNNYTIRKATQGLVNFIKSSGDEMTDKSVAIAYDSRMNSSEYAEEVALVLAANQIRAYLFESLRPTPELSFTVRHLNCDAGVVITASHNPPEYNGFKVYGSDGAQITLVSAQQITIEINRLDIFNDVHICPKEEAIQKKLLVYIGEDIDKMYISNILSLSIHPNSAHKVKNFKIVYTPIHGSGLIPITKILNKLGYQDIHVVASQKDPDGFFPTVRTPNPEEREALSEGIRLAIELKAEIVIGTDPDADRVGVAIRNEFNHYDLLTGNQIGALLTHYILSNKRIVSDQDAVVKTIVTSDLGANIARSYGATVFETLTGFKFIGEKIKEFESGDEYKFLFGYEESYGYLAGTFVRDKDAVISTALIVEMAAYYKLRNKTLIQVIEDIYQEFGYFLDAQDNYTFEGIEGQRKIESSVNKFRDLNHLRKEFSNLTSIEDYASRKRLLVDTDLTENILLPFANVIKIYLSDKSWFAIRPSGTEPKLKIYYSTYGMSAEETIFKMNALAQKVKNILFN